MPKKKSSSKKKTPEEKRIDRVADILSDLNELRDIMMSSRDTMILKLEERGFIKRTPRQARSIVVLLLPEQLPPLE